MLLLELDGPSLLVRIIGPFELDAALCLESVAADYLARGGGMDDVVVDLHRAVPCSTVALERLASLMAAGVQVHDVRRPERRRRSREDRRRARSGA